MEKVSPTSSKEDVDDDLAPPHDLTRTSKVSFNPSEEVPGQQPFGGKTVRQPLAQIRTYAGLPKHSEVSGFQSNNGISNAQQETV